MNQARNRQELLSWINKVSFMAYDMALYLDTHPDDQQALEFFQNSARCAARLFQTMRPNSDH